MATAKATKILYIHGFESGPDGIKATALRKHFTVYGEQQKVGAFKFNKNSILMNIIKQQFLHICGIIGSIVGCYYYFNKQSNPNKYAYTSLVGILCLSTLFIQTKSILSKALKSTFESAIEIQKQAIIKYNPDLIIGSSFGGAVTIELIRRQKWNKPTILLAPGYTKVMSYIHYNVSDISNALYLMKLNTYSNNKNILIIHGDKDTAIELKDSQKIQNINKDIMDLQIIPNEDHNLHQIAQNGQLSNIVQTYINSP
eukprot:148847_1